MKQEKKNKNCKCFTHMPSLDVIFCDNGIMFLNNALILLTVTEVFLIVCVVLILFSGNFKKTFCLI